MPRKWLQERANGSKNEHGITLEGPFVVQGYLAHKKPLPRLGPPNEPRHVPTVGSYGMAISHKRGTPVGVGDFTFRVKASSLDFRVQGSEFRVEGSGLRVQGLGFKVQGPRVRF